MGGTGFHAAHWRWSSFSVGGAAALGLNVLSACVLGFNVGLGMSMGVAALTTALSLALFYGWRAPA